MSGVMPYTFRPAVESDIQAITDIYNASVVVGGATADLTPRTLDQRRAWVESHKPPYGVFVAESEGGQVIGFGSLSVFYDRAGYDGVTDLATTSPPHGKAGEWARSCWTISYARPAPVTCAKPAASSLPTTPAQSPHATIRLHPVRPHARRRHRLHRHHA